MKQALASGTQDMSRWRQEVEKLVTALEDVRSEEDKFILNSINADLGSGE